MEDMEMTASPSPPNPSGEEAAKNGESAGEDADVEELPPVKGFIKTSLLDWDGHIVSTIYLPGCNFRCPFCHNSALVLSPGDMETIPWSEVSAYLMENGDFLDGVCVTGGEPTLHPTLPRLLRTIKDMGLMVKFDTNGTNPDKLKELMEEGLLDYIAMDIKAPLDERYMKAVGLSTDLEKIEESIRIIMEGNVDYEFRTTVVPGITGPREIEDIARHIEGARRYALQQFVPRNTMDPAMMDVAPYTPEEVRDMARTAGEYVREVRVRGLKDLHG
ncbi:MAG: anaerobic ribonucleoside-triphosphate reductase activating protein [Thermoplasmata archaeon]|nr:anaerobic ribonucleoside-triphosphate reductase activating protein [Thermoplasmata archaeon]